MNSTHTCSWHIVYLDEVANGPARPSVRKNCGAPHDPTEALALSPLAEGRLA